MKTITIRLADVEAAMLEQLRRHDKHYREIADAFVDMISRDYKSLVGEKNRS